MNTEQTSCNFELQMLNAARLLKYLAQCRRTSKRGFDSMIDPSISCFRAGMALACYALGDERGAIRYHGEAVKDARMLAMRGCYSPNR